MVNLYVTEPGAMLRKEGGRLVVAQGDNELASLPAAHVEQVVVVTGAGVTTPALHFLLERGISVVMLSASGSFRGRLTGSLAKNVALRRQQYRRADDERFSTDIARAIVLGKLANCRTRCFEMAEVKADPVVTTATDALRALIARATMVPSRAELRGLEGAGTLRYFEVVRRFLRPPWIFERRARRPPPDPVNALFSLLATFLQGTCVGAIETVGLDPYSGFLHEEHYGRPSLALDLMEEFRPVVAEAIVLMLLNKRMVRPASFISGPDGGVRLTPDGWRVVATQYTKRLQQRVRPAPDEAAVTYQSLIERQARKLRDVIEGTAERYVPYQAR